MPNHLAERQTTVEPVDQVTERMRRMAEQMFAGLGTPALLAEASSWTPFVDIEEADDAYVLEVELPGHQEADIGPDDLVETPQAPVLTAEFRP